MGSRKRETQNGEPKWGHKMWDPKWGTRNGAPKMGDPKWGTQNGGPENGGPENGEPKKGDPKWGAEMGAQNGDSKWGAQNGRLEMWDPKIGSGALKWGFRGVEPEMDIYICVLYLCLQKQGSERPRTGQTRHESAAGDFVLPLNQKSD